MGPIRKQTTGRVSLRLSNAALDELGVLAAQKGISKTEVLRRALAVYDYVSEAGDRVSIKRKDGSIETLLIP